MINAVAAINNVMGTRVDLGSLPGRLNHDGTDGSDRTGFQSVSPVPSASVAGPSVPSVSNSRSN